MTPTFEEQIKDRLKATNAREYGSLYHYINWIDGDRAALAAGERRRLVGSPGVLVSCRGTKIHHGPLSPGCRQCAAQAWSCLFICGRCNGRCFYCPTSQNADDPPMSGSVPFPRAADFAAYVRFFGFGGASISGGEPFLEFDKSLDYVRALRQTCGPDLHIWLYTNGILTTESKLRQLAQAGLDEIRFDIGATDYALRHVRTARGIVPTVTVEIPAVPEEEERLLQLLPELHQAGVSHLNLHQLRLTPHNARNLLEHDYTFVHGHKVTVLESELCALRLVAASARDDLPLAVNYCSFVYKHRFQAAASRTRFGPRLLDEHEALTASGFIRTVQIRRKNTECWNPVALDSLETCAAGDEIRVGYAAGFLRDHANPGLRHQTVSVSPDFQVVLERHAARTPLATDPTHLIHSMAEPLPDLPMADPSHPGLNESWEWITPGLGPYF
jgi:pyruvate formate-lyase activating enzyme-like uncharacterized protein